jgi:hypothetical protein
MRAKVHITAVLTATCLSAGCGGSVGTAPTAPSPVPGPVPPSASGLPSLVGTWRASGGVEFQDTQTGASVDSAGCNGNWFFETQNGNEFSGHAGFTGSGVHSDKICTGAMDFTGAMNTDGVLNVTRTGGNFPSGRCSNVSNAERIDGAINSDGTITLQSTRPGTCLDAGDRPREVMVIARVALTRR